MKELLEEDYPAWQDSFLAFPEHGIRINELKTDPESFRELWSAVNDVSLQGALSDPVEWIHNGFHIRDTAVFSCHPFYQAGLYYIQEPSAMTPAEVLPIENGDYVLDLCAAPGGKATELLAKLRGTGLLYANDISVSRAQALRKNIEMAGATNAYITAESPEKLAASFPCFFDKILVDGPCSGEGMFRRKPDMVRDWEEKGPYYYAPLQYKILEAAVRMLRPGGMMVYSTCTFSEIENEGNVGKLLKEHPDLEIRNVPEYPGFLKSRISGLEGCVRVMPHRMRGEGQFVCLIHKKVEAEMPEKERRKQVMPKLHAVEDRLYLLPPGHMPRAGIRYLMSGLHIGTFKSGILSPSQALAQAIRKEDWARTLNLKSTDDRLLRYLKGESIPYRDEEIVISDKSPAEIFGVPTTLEKGKKGKNRDQKKNGKRFDKSRAPHDTTGFENKLYAGDILILADGFPVGFGSDNRGILKNKRNPGWRSQ